MKSGSSRVPSPVSGPDTESARPPKRSRRVRVPGLAALAGLVVVAALGAAACVPVVAQTPASPATISGQVLASDTGEGIEGVVVYRYETTPEPDIVRAVAITDEDGRYSFGVDTGEHALVFNPGAWTLPSLEDGAAFLYAADSRALTVSDGDAAVVDVTLVAVNRGSISGTVTDVVTGDPVAGVEVHASAIWGGSAVTGEDGTYTIPYLPSSGYYVHFDGSAVGYGSTFWNLDEWDIPGEVEVGFNEAVTGVDAALARQTVTYTARYHEQRQCSLIGAVAGALGVPESEVVRHGVNAFRGLAEANAQYATWAEATGTELPSIAVPSGEPACAIDVTWDASEAPAIESAAAFFGGAPDELHEGGGWLVVVVIIQAALQAR